MRCSSPSIERLDSLGQWRPGDTHLPQIWMFPTLFRLIKGLLDSSGYSAATPSPWKDLCLNQCGRGQTHNVLAGQKKTCGCMIKTSTLPQNVGYYVVVCFSPTGSFHWACSWIYTVLIWQHICTSQHNKNNNTSSPLIFLQEPTRTRVIGFKAVFFLLFHVDLWVMFSWDFTKFSNKCWI